MALGLITVGAQQRLDQVFDVLWLIQVSLRGLAGHLLEQDFGGLRAGRSIGLRQRVPVLSRTCMQRRSMSMVERVRQRTAIGSQVFDVVDLIGVVIVRSLLGFHGLMKILLIAVGGGCCRNLLSEDVYEGCYWWTLSVTLVEGRRVDWLLGW